MPNYESSVRKNLDPQIEKLQKLYNSSFNSAEKKLPTVSFINNFINILKNLVNVSNSQYENLGDNSINIQKPMQEEDFQNLSDAYMSAMHACQRYMNMIPEASLNSPAFMKIQQKATPITKVVQEISATLSPDIHALKLYDPKKGPVSFQQLIANASPLELNIGKNDLGTIGAQLSKRVPFNYTMPDGKEVKGVFTPKNISDPEGNFNKAVESANEKIPGFKDFIDTYYTSVEASMGLKPKEDGSVNPAVLRSLCMQSSVIMRDKNSPPTTKTKEEFSNSINKLASNLKKSNHNELSDKLLDAYNKISSGDQKIFSVAMDNYIKSAFNIAANMSVNQSAGIEPGSRIDSRNSAMSRVAEMLKVPNLIAKASPMTVTYKGEKIEGTFMAKGKGMDYNHPTKDSMEYNDKTFQTNVLKSIADLQVLDLICGNIDRHMANMLYQFDTTGDPQNHKFIGVQGIDNDASFGEITAHHDLENGKFPNLDRLNIISESMAKAVLKLDRDEFKFNLREYGLSEKQLEAAAKRLDLLKEKILDGDTYYRNKENREALKKSGKIVKERQLLTIKDDQFANIKLDKLPQNSFIFTKLSNFGEAMKNKVADGKELETKNINTNTGYKLKDSEVNNVKQYLSDMQNATGRRGTSPEFEKLRDTVGKYNEFCQDNKDGILSPVQYDKRMEHLKAIRNASVEYMKHKGLVDENNKIIPDALKKQSSYAKKRIELVGKIAGDCVNELQSTDKDFYRNIIKNRSAELANKNTPFDRKEFLESERKMFSDFNNQAEDNLISKKLGEDSSKTKFSLGI